MNIPPGAPPPPPPWPPSNAPGPSGFGGYPPPQPPPKPNRNWLWAGLCAVVVVALVAGLLVWKGTSGSSGESENPTPTADGAGGTVGLLTEKDPICDDWLAYGKQLTEAEEQWAQVDEKIPAANWTEEQRRIYSSVSQAMSRAADKYESILPSATHPVIQELAAQTIVYLRGYVDRIPTYVAEDNGLIEVATMFDSALSNMCAAVPLIATNSGESQRAKVTDPAQLQPIFNENDAICVDFVALLDRQQAQLRGWFDTDPTLPAAQWSDQQKNLNTAVQAVMRRDADEARKLAGRTDNPAMHDLLVAYAAYLTAYADAVPTYIPDEHLLWQSARFLGSGLLAVCEGAYV